MNSNIYHFCITVCEEKYTQKVVKKLEANNFITKTESLHSKEILAYLNLKSENGMNDFLREAEIMKIEKPRKERKSFNPDFVAKYKERFTNEYSNYISQRPNLPPDVRALEKYKLFEIRKKEKFLKNENDSFDSIFTNGEILMVEGVILEKIITEFEHDTEINVHHFEEFCQIHPLHVMEAKSKIPSSLDELKDYYGASVAIYFYFVEYMQKWLLAASAVGILVFSLNYVHNEDADSSPYDSAYSLFMIIWAFLFLVSWEKRQKQLVYKWRYNGKKFFFAHRHNDHQLETKKNLVTGENVVYVSPMRKFLMYLKSFLITVPILIITIIILILSLNMRGYITEDYEFLYIADLANLSGEGQIFDKNSNKAYFTTFIHVAVLNYINLYYSKLCHQLSENEVHMTENGFNNSLIAKRFIFEIFNTFLDLSFLAYVKTDIKALKNELISLYMVDEFRRVLTETIIPLVLKKMKSIMRVPQLQQLTYNEYEDFDDYLEIVLNFAYLILFASAFPLAPILTYIFHFIELKSDKFKINHCYQRPRPRRTKGIGAWLQVMRIVAYIAIYSNIVLFAYSSSQIAEYFPWMYENMEVIDGHFHAGVGAKLITGMGRFQVLIIFIIEHVVFIACYVLTTIIRKKKDWTNVFQDRRDYRSRIFKFKKDFAIVKYSGK